MSSFHDFRISLALQKKIGCVSRSEAVHSEVGPVEIRDECNTSPEDCENLGFQDFRAICMNKEMTGLTSPILLGHCSLPCKFRHQAARAEDSCTCWNVHHNRWVSLLEYFGRVLNTVELFAICCLHYTGCFECML